MRARDNKRANAHKCRAERVAGDFSPHEHFGNQAVLIANTSDLSGCRQKLAAAFITFLFFSIKRGRIAVGSGMNAHLLVEKLRRDVCAVWPADRAVLGHREITEVAHVPQRLEDGFPELIS